MSRGALLVLEGCDRAGKSTQVKKLIQALNERGIRAEGRAFPDRRTTIGGVIDQFLSNKNDLPPEAVHLLFSANRWECVADMKKALNAGTTLIVDRYAASGAAYAAVSTKKPLAWCKEPDKGLPAPDFVALLTISKENQESRAGYGEERFERTEFQQSVAENFEKLKEDTWKVLQADQSIGIDESIEKLHQQLLDEAVKVIERVKGQPIKLLYES